MIQKSSIKKIASMAFFVVLMVGAIFIALQVSQNQATSDSSAATAGCIVESAEDDTCWTPQVETSGTGQTLVLVDPKTKEKAPTDVVEEYKELFTTSTGTISNVCKPKLPSIAKLISPRNKTEITQPTVTIEWEKNGTFGKECKDNGKADRYILKYAVVAKDKTCPAIGSKYKSRQLTVKVAGQKEYSVQISNLQHDKKYCWFIRAKNGETKSETRVRSFTTNLSDVAIQPSFPEETLEVVEGNTEIEVVSNNE